MASDTISPAALAARLSDGSEIAVLDVRAEAAYLAGHLLPAVNMPLHRLGDLAPGFVPRRSTPTVLCDDGDGVARQAAERLGAAGYDQVIVLDGGVRAWAAAGRELFETGYAQANCFGLAVQACYATPRIDGAELMRRQAAGAPLVVVDSRPFEEFHAATVPGAVNLPAAELFHRIQDHLPDGETTVVVHCGGKTRGILGCQSLINAGLPNPVVALDEGTMDWVLPAVASNRAPSVSRRRLRRRRGRRLARRPAESPAASASGASARASSRPGAGRPTAARSTWWTCAAARSTRPGICRTRAGFRAGSSPAAPRTISPRATPGSAWSTTMARAPS